MNRRSFFTAFAAVCASPMVLGRAKPSMLRGELPTDVVKYIKMKRTGMIFYDKSGNCYLSGDPDFIRSLNVTKAGLESAERWLERAKNVT